MPKLTKTIQLQDPSFNEFVYTIAATNTVFDERKMPEKYKRVLSSPKAAKTFCKKASVDSKKEFLNYLGFRSMFIVSGIETVWSKEVQKVVKDFTESKKLLNNPKLNDGLYVTTDKQLVHSLSTLSQDVVSSAYRMTQEMYRLKHRKSVKWDVRLDDDSWKDLEKSEKEVKGAINQICDIVDIFLGSEISPEKGSMQTRMLLHFFLNKNKYIKHDELVKELGAVIPKSKVRPIERRLLEKYYIQQHFDFRENSFTITSLGIRKIMEFIIQLFPKPLID